MAVVTRETRMQGLKNRWATARNAAFRMNYAAEHEIERRRKQLSKKKQPAIDELALADIANALVDDENLADEDENYQLAVDELLREIDLGFPVKSVDRKLVSNFDFGRCVAVIVIGQDGLVANTAKYADKLPIIGVNPEPARYDGELLPFNISKARRTLQRVLKGNFRSREVTLGLVETNDGQRMLAFNDFFLGARSHVSARYTLEVGSQTEDQSSSGLLVSTGAGSTGWMSSVFNMARGLSRTFGETLESTVSMDWEDRRLFWAVREPFISQESSADSVAGFIEEGDELIVGSQMANNGVIFSDGIESDCIEFNAGTIARFSISEQRANLVVE